MKALTCASYDYMKLMVSELQRQLRELENTGHSLNSQKGPIAPPRRQAPSKAPNKNEGSLGRQIL